MYINMDMGMVKNNGKAMELNTVMGMDTEGGMDIQRLRCWIKDIYKTFCPVSNTVADSTLFSMIGRF
jgi:hypothetical protein